MKGKRVHQLNLTYEEYKSKSISNSKIDKYFVYEQIGRGSFGSVFKGMNDETKNTVAIKVLDLAAVEQQQNPKIKQIRKRLCATQSQLMMVCNSDNLVKCYDVYENKFLKIMVIQFCNGGTLQQQIDMKGKIPEREAILILKQILNGIAELHSHKIIHRDLKSQNILSHNGVYKIADFGFSKQIDQSQIRQTTLGTITTMAPQVMNKKPYGLKADIWSIGVIFFQMIFGKVPYTSTTANQMYFEIKSKKILSTETFTFNNCTASKEVTKFLKQILQIESQQRLGWKEVVNHSLFKSDDQKLINQFRLNPQLLVPTTTEEMQNTLKNQQQTIIQFGQSCVENNPHQIIHMTQVEANQKKKEMKNNDDKLYEWVKLTHLECLKTELIYEQIIQVIEKNKLLDLTDRSVIEFMYLLNTRCMNNISVINDKLENQQNQNVIKNLERTVKKLYQKVRVSWQKYSQLLTQAEDKVASIIKDRFLKIFKKQTITEKDQYLTGIETIEYSKSSQINFTDKAYITDILPQLKSGSQKSNKVKSYLSHYIQINNIRLQDLKQRSFQQYVDTIIQ